MQSSGSRNPSAGRRFACGFCDWPVSLDYLQTQGRDGELQVDRFWCLNLSDPPREEDVELMGCCTGRGGVCVIEGILSLMWGLTGIGYLCKLP